MRKFIYLSIFVSMFFTSSIYSQDSAQVTIKWYGHSCFMMTTSEGTRIVTDPVNKWYKYQPHRAEVVTVSHNHSDHNAVQIVWNNPKILYGKTRNESDQEQKFIKIDETFRDVHIYSVNSHHFKPDHSPCLNAIFVFEFDGLRIAHLGDLGRVLTPEQLEEIGKIDVLMIPVGGYYTVEINEADEIIAQLNPKIVFPMHYRNDVVDFLPNTVEDFLNGKKNIQEIDGSEYIISTAILPQRLTYVVLDYK
ncbi:MBL fold metallo-hydrolase [Bacteroidota bacterium]